MQSVLLVINAGSSSIKFAIFKTEAIACLYRGQIAGIASGLSSRFSIRDKQTDEMIFEAQDIINDHQQALQLILNWLADYQNALDIVAVGHRIVHGGNQYYAPVIIDSTVLADLEELIPLAPLHQPHNLIAIKALQTLQADLTQVACFDTAFHHSQPEVAKMFALPKKLYDEGIQRYGFHGLSYQYIASILSDYSEKAAKGRTIIAHLGQGASLCAMKNGKSIATTMTFTPLDGLPMGTRCGAIDPAVVLYLLRTRQRSIDAVSDLLHHQSGLAGLSGISGDMKTLLESRQVEAQKAVDIFVYHVVKEVGAMAATLQGMDSLVFTAGIGEHAPQIREKICLAMKWLDLEIDLQANNQNATKISSQQSSVSVWVIPTNEEKMIASQTQLLAFGDKHEQSN